MTDANDSNQHGLISIHSDESGVLQLQINAPHLYGPGMHEVLWLSLLDAVKNHPSHHEVLVDFQNLSHVTSSMISVLIRLQRNIEEQSKCLGLIGMAPGIRDIFRVMNLDGTKLLIFDSKDDALSYFASHPSPSSPMYRRPHRGSDTSDL